MSTQLWAHTCFLCIFFSPLALLVLMLRSPHGCIGGLVSGSKRPHDSLGIGPVPGSVSISNGSWIMLKCCSDMPLGRRIGKQF